MKKMLHYTLCGLDNIFLLNGFRLVKLDDGEKGLSIDDVDGLHIAIASDLIKVARELSGKEFRFLRKELDLSQKRIADLLGREEQAVANWEKKNNVDPMADRLIRLLWLEQARQNPHIRDLLQRLQEIDHQEYAQRHYKETKSGWRPAA